MKKVSDPADAQSDTYNDLQDICGRGQFSEELLPAPVILTPPPAHEFPGGTHVLVSGTCLENAQVEVHTPNGKWGDAVVVGTRWFYYRVWGEHWPYNDWFGWVGREVENGSIYAVQSVDDVWSAPSYSRLFSVGKLEKSPVPEVSFPKGGEDIVLKPGVMRVYSFGRCVEGAHIDVMHSVFGLYEGISVESSGVWLIGLNTSPGRQSWTQQFRQTVPGMLPSEFTSPITTVYTRTHGVGRGFDPVPDESPTVVRADKPNAPTISIPAHDVAHLRWRFLFVQGTCEEGAIVEVSYNQFEGDIHEAVVVGKSFYCRAGGRFRWGVGKELCARQSVRGSEFSDWSEPITITVALCAPLVLGPEPQSSHPVTGDLYLSGVCDRQAVVEVRDARTDKFLGEAIVSGTTWVFHHKWSRGTHCVQVRQTYEGQISPQSPPFEFVIR